MTSASMVAPFGRRLEGKVAIITGGASGIGKCTVKLFVHHGAKVVIADVQDELGHSLCKELGSDEFVCFIHCDVSKETDIQNVVDTTVSKYGKIDIMFNNAAISGSGYGASVLDTDQKDFERVLSVNLIGAFMGAKHAARVMIPHNKGSIIFTSGAVSSICFNAPHPYAASKHGLVGVAKNLCAELGQYGIRVNCISPYVVATPAVCQVLGSTEEASKVEKLACNGANLKGVVLKAEDIAHAALYLASDESGYVSGINLAVDGGYGTVNLSLPNAITKALEGLQS